MSRRQTAIYWLMLACVCFVFYLWNVCTPLFSDDWDVQMQTVLEFPQNLMTNYLTRTGRMVSHACAHTFVDFLGKGVFNVVNTFLFALFLHLIALRQKGDKIHTLLVTLTVLLCIDWGFKFSFLWMSGACNYLWAAVLFLLLDRYISRPVAFPLAFLAGMTNEALVLGVITGLLVSKKISTKRDKCLFAVFLLSSLLCIFAPGNIVRAMETEGETAMMHQFGLSRIVVTLNDLLHIYGLWFTIAVCLLLRFLKRLTFAELWSKERFLLSAIAAQLLFAIVLGMINERSCFGVEMCALFLLLRLLRYQTSMTYLCAVPLFAVMIVVTLAAKGNSSEWQSTIRQMKSTSDGIIEIEPKHPSWIQNKYMLWICSGTPGWYQHYDHTAWPISHISQKYGDKPFIFLPKDLVQDARAGKVDSVFTKKYYPLYVKRMDRLQSFSFVSLIMRKATNDEIPLFYRPMAERLARYALLRLDNVPACSIVKIDGMSFLVTLRDEQLDDRVVDMLVE